MVPTPARRDPPRACSSRLAVLIVIGAVAGPVVSAGACSSERKPSRSAAAAGASGAGGGGGAAAADGSRGDRSTDPNLRVAFIGDQGLGTNPKAVLQLIEDEKADFVIHPGDFDYADDPDAWDAMIDEVLGASYPYFGTVGNHDVTEWPRYREKLAQRMARVPGVQCRGDELFVTTSCTYRGLYFILSGVGTQFIGQQGIIDHVGYLESALAADDSVWRLCTWHKNRRDFQAGTKPDEVPLAAYEKCQAGRAAIVNAHEHSYARTLTLTDVGNAAARYGVTGSPDVLSVRHGATFVVVSGLAGASLRDYAADLHDDDTWWATLYAGGKHLKNGTLVSGGAYDYGALFVDFHVDGDPKKARGYFKNVRGELVDEFTVNTE